MYLSTTKWLAVYPNNTLEYRFERVHAAIWQLMVSYSTIAYVF